MTEKRRPGLLLWWIYAQMAVPILGPLLIGLVLWGGWHFGGVWLALAIVLALLLLGLMP
jgi:hypothetical protein